MDELLQRLKQRKLVQWAIAYVAAAFALLQGIDIIAQQFGWPEWMRRGITLGLVVGFFVTLVLAWYHGERGAQRVTGTELIILALLLAIGGGFLWRYAATSRPAVDSASGPPPTVQPTIAGIQIPPKSIAVLPFQNLSKDEENAFFADGVQDEILTDLARIADLKVISRTSVMQYKDSTKRNLPEIAQALKVAHVLEGSVQRAEHRVRVSAQLIDARTDAHLWAQRFDGDLSDVFAIQAEIAQKIADQLQAVLSPKEKADIAAKPTSDVTAYDLYLRATELLRSFEAELEPVQREVIRLLEEATARDPKFVPALCALANTHLALYWFNYDHTEAGLAAAQTAIAAAERLKPDAGEVHQAKGLLYYWGSRDYEPALAELQRAHTSLPNNSLVLLYIGSVQRRQGRLDEASRQLEKALKLDPRSTRVVNTLAETYEGARRYKDAARVLEEGLRWKPDDFTFASFRADLDRVSRADLKPTETFLTSEAAKNADPDAMAEVRMRLAMTKRDYTAAEQALASYKSGSFGGGSGFTLPRELLAGVIARRQGDSKKAENAFLIARSRAADNLASRPDDAKTLVVLGLIDAYLGHKEEAVREGQRAVELLPVTKDALSGPDVLLRLAEIYVETSNADRALDVLERVAPINFGPSYGELKLEPVWDPLRGNPRFEKIVQSLAPK